MAAALQARASPDLPLTCLQNFSQRRYAAAGEWPSSYAVTEFRWTSKLWPICSRLPPSCTHFQSGGASQALSGGDGARKPMENT